MLNRQNSPIFDMHCDLLCYLAEEPDADPGNADEIGCAVPRLRDGNVRLQVMAAYTAAEEGSVRSLRRQVEWYERLLRDHGDAFVPVHDAGDLGALPESDRTGIVFAVENASGLLEEEEPLDLAFSRLEEIVDRLGRVLYLSLTHHGRNRFGGGNATRSGLGDDGRVLLEYLDGRDIAVDLAHASDWLAHDILDRIDAKGWSIPLLASHSNFRAVQDHPRNLPDEFVRELVRRQGLIGINFLREYIHPGDPSVLAEHLRYGVEVGAENALCFGADYFCTRGHPDRSRIPFYFPEHEHAGKYPEILRSLEEVLDGDRLEAVSHGNALRFIERLRGGGA